MAAQLRIHAADTRRFDNAIDLIDRVVRSCVANSNIDRPVLVMHWTNRSGDGLACHWDIDVPWPKSYRP